MNKKRFYEYSLKQKLLIILSILLVLSGFFSIMMYYYSNSVMKNSIVEKNNSQADFFVDSVDSQIATAEEMVQNLLIDRKLTYLIFPNYLLSEYELMQTYLSQQERLKHLLLSSPLIESATIYLPNRSQKINDDFVGKMTDEDFEQMRSLYKKREKAIIFSNNELYLISTGIYSATSKQTPDVLFVVNFSASKIKDNLSNFNIYPGSTTLYQLESKEFISTNTENAIVESWEEKIEPTITAWNEDEGFNRNISVDHKKYRIQSIPSQYLGTFYQFIPYDEFFGKLNYIHFMFIFYLIATISVAFYVSRYLDNYVHRPLNKLVRLFREVESGDLEVSVMDDKNRGLEFDYVFASFNDMKIQLKELIDQIYVQQNLLQKAQLKQLQAQINPHFLYNSFFSLNRKLKREDIDSAMQLSEHLGTYFRFLARSGDDTITLAEEVLHAKSYASIQQIRFYDRITVAFGEVPEEFNDVLVPRLIVQPIIENAFKYGLENLEEEGLLTVSFIPETDKLIIRVDDNGDGLTDEILNQLQSELEDATHQDITGVINIHRRIKIFFGPESGLEVSRNSQQGLRVDLILILKSE